MSKLRILFLLLSAAPLAVLMACGGGNTLTSGGGGGGGGTGGGGGGGSVSAPVLVTTIASAPVTGIDITVVSPASNPTPNAANLGVTPALGAGSVAFNNGSPISRGTAQDVFLFGPGLSGNMQITITGPTGEIGISNIQGIFATDNTPGIIFTATVPSSAALGARTVILKDANNDITTFTGGLEVTP